MLKADMLECLASSHLFAAATTDLALGKLAASESSAARLDSMDLMAAMVTRWQRESTALPSISLQKKLQAIS